MQLAALTLLLLLAATGASAGPVFEPGPGLDPRVADLVAHAEAFGWTLEKARTTNEPGWLHFAAPLGGGRARVAIATKLDGPPGRGPESEAAWMRPEQEYFDGQIIVGNASVERDGHVALETALAVLAEFRGVPGVTLTLYEHPCEPYRFWVEFTFEAFPDVQGSGKPRARMRGGTLTSYEGRVRQLEAGVGLMPAQLEALAELVASRGADDSRIAALGVRRTWEADSRWEAAGPHEVALMTTGWEPLEASVFACIERLTLDVDGRLRVIESLCVRPQPASDRASWGSTSWSGSIEAGEWVGKTASLRQGLGPFCLSGVDYDDYHPPKLVLPGVRFRVLFGEVFGEDF